MAAIPINGLYKDDLSDAKKSEIQSRIKERVPTGFSQHTSTLKGTRHVLDEITETVQPSEYLENQLLLPRVTDQLGTLGGGNHFIEVLYEEVSQQVWVMLHSGSRNIGNRTAAHYDLLAEHDMRQRGMSVDAIRALNGLNYLRIESTYGHDYLRDMEWCQQYAYHNRRVMQTIVLDIMEKVTRKKADGKHAVNIHHNYCACEQCGDRKLWVTRKGATSAREGEMGIIPGSMGTGSYITRGRGNKDSWYSSSHGAGRKLSRTKAHSLIEQAVFEQSMNGIVCDTHPGVKDEAPMAYKNLEEVMRHQESLTDVVYRLLPLINVKGFEKKIPKKYRKDKKHGH